MPTCGDYIMHFLTLFWKIIFAFIPPAGEYFLSHYDLMPCNRNRNVDSDANSLIITRVTSAITAATGLFCWQISDCKASLLLFQEKKEVLLYSFCVKLIRISLTRFTWRLYNLYCFHHYHWHDHCRYWRCGLPLGVLHLPQGYRECYSFRGVRHLSPR